MIIGSEKRPLVRAAFLFVGFWDGLLFSRLAAVVSLTSALVLSLGHFRQVGDIELEPTSSRNSEREMDTTAGIKTEQSILPSLLLMGLAFIGFNLFERYERFYCREPLVEYQLVIQDAPTLVKVRRGTDRYTFSAVGYRCKFWISRGALKIVRDNDSAERQLKLLAKGDTISAFVREQDSPVLQNLDARPRVIALDYKYTTLIDSCDVYAEDYMSACINFGAGILALLLWLLLFVRKKTRSV